MNDNAVFILLILICLSTCGKPDLWDATIIHLTKQECVE